MEAHVIRQADSLSTRWTGLGHHWRARRAAGTAFRTLDHELAGYTTPAELDELEAIVERAERKGGANLADFRRIIKRRRSSIDTAHRTIGGVPVEALLMMSMTR